MINVIFYIWRVGEGDNIGGICGPLLVIFVIHVARFRFVFFAGYDFVGIYFLEDEEDCLLL